MFPWMQSITNTPSWHWHYVTKLENVSSLTLLWIYFSLMSLWLLTLYYCLCTVWLCFKMQNKLKLHATNHKGSFPILTSNTLSKCIILNKFEIQDSSGIYSYSISCMKPKQLTTPYQCYTKGYRATTILQNKIQECYLQYFGSVWWSIGVGWVWN